MNVIVNYKEALAHYEIRKEAAGVYFADLLQYDGEETSQPAKAIILIRNIRNWSGSCDDEFLINKLGEIIEKEVFLPEVKKRKKA